ncbi:sigma-70 family RNA polymerase sigma factor [Glycomyces sp. L485]|uniref:sigma-70 family RNA polymerase sigma factor n=1 Tax=Glycomyces sp. L485 TaxID=2909235 RepID=UPI001F4A9ABA|nr:sigma-70 family RNA polymerase sigma factor [Glycomyces sp. L485]MCH7232032.1 sigma-70 family RNA polymerase sigma factor [Glycomyces sp. L485]
MPETIPAGEPRRTDARSPEDRSDPELIAATRGGDTTAYAVLYERHVHAGRRLARVLAQDAAAADDLVSETFAKLLHTFREGTGPDLAFRPYMLRTLRNTFYDRLRRDKRVEYTDDIAKHESVEVFTDPAVEGAERRYAALAFGKLPERWRTVLWHTEVEEDSPARVASMLGLTPNGVSALAYRAREQLRQNYLNEHAADSPPEECRWTVDHLGARVRGRLGVRDSGKVDAHLDGCVSCNLLSAELAELNSGMRGAIAGVFLGAAAAPYLTAGAASVAGIAVGGAVALLAAPFMTAADWIRSVVQYLGAKGTIATGSTAAVVAAAAIFALAPVEPDEETRAAPDPPAATDPLDEDPVEPEQDDPDPAETGPDPDPGEPGPEPGEEPAEPAPDDDEPIDVPAVPAVYDIVHGLGATGLEAGVEAVLPIRLDSLGSGGGSASRTEEAGAAEHSQVASGRVTLAIDVPEGVTLASETAEPGWRCESEADRIRCSVGRMPASASADVRIGIADGLSGYQTFAITVSGPDISGASELRVPVAPAGSVVGYAGLDATGVTAAGNTLMTCAVPACLAAAAQGGGDRYPMKAYKASKGEPQPPAGRGGEALSGAVLEIPADAEVAWAGLYWAGARDDLPTDVSLAEPGGSWTDLGADAVRAAGPGAQAFADVTGLVSGGGEYWLAIDDHPLPMSGCVEWPPPAEPDCLEPRWAGWSLTVVYAEPGAEPREVAVYDGALASDTAIDVRGGGEVGVAHTLWGGSAYRSGDRLSIGPTGFGEPATSRANGALNNPHWYTFGVDIAVNSATLGEAGAIRIDRSGDPFIAGVVAVAAPSG